MWKIFPAQAGHLMKVKQGYTPCIKQKLCKVKALGISQWEFVLISHLEVTEIQQ